MQMRTSILSVGIMLLASAASVYGDPVRDRMQSPCFNVSIQNERVNESEVHQDCNVNFSRTVQAGQHNQAATIQTGDINNSKVRQYQYDHLRYRDRTRGD
jgi:hypothetical protein